MTETPATELTEPEPYTVKVTPAEYEATVEKIARINARAERKGWTGRLTVVGERLEQDEVDEYGWTRTEVAYRVRIEGEAPKYAGWTFLARVTRVGDSFTLDTAPGVERIDRSLVRAGECDHCGHDRQRNTTYLVRSEAGETHNVGSTCIKDFLGWAGHIVWISAETEQEDIFGGFGGGPRAYAPATVLAFAYAATKAFGFVRSMEPGSTRDAVRAALDPWTKADREVAQTLAPLAAEAQEMVAKIVAFVQSDAFDGSGYTDNSKVAVAAEYVTSRQMGLLASLPQAYLRGQERQVARAEREAQKAAEPESQHVGAVGDKVLIAVTITGLNYFHHNFGTTTLYTLKDEAGNVYKWFASRSALGDDKGVKVTVKGTVKSHDEYKGQRQTVLTRCKAI